MTASGNPAVAIGGDGGSGGFDIPLDGSGGGGNGGSATAAAVESAASGAVTASASATAGRGGWSYSGPSYGGDASASATATSGDVTIAATAWTSGFEFENPGILPYGLPKPYADASATVLSGDVSDGVITFGIADVDGNGDFPGFGDSFTLSFFDPSYRGELFVNGFDFGFYPGDFAMTIDGPGEFVISGAVPQTSTWAMMLLGFAGLGLAGYRRANSSNPTRA